MNNIVDATEFTKSVDMVDTAESGLLFPPPKPDMEVNIDNNRLDNIGMSENFARENYDEYESFGVVDPDDVDFLKEATFEIEEPDKTEEPDQISAAPEQERGFWSKALLPSPQEMRLPFGYEKMSAFQRVLYKSQLLAQSTMTRLGGDYKLQMKSGLPVDKDDRPVADVPLLGELTFGLESVGYIGRTYLTYAVGGSIAKDIGLSKVLDKTGMKLASGFFGKAAQAEASALNILSKQGLKAWSYNTLGKFFIKYPKTIGMMIGFSELTEATEAVTEGADYEPVKAAGEGLLWATVLRTVYAPIAGLRLTTKNLSGKTATELVKQTVVKVALENPLLIKDEEMLRTNIRESAAVLYKESFGVKPSEKIINQIAEKTDDALVNKSSEKLVSLLAKTLTKEELALQNLEQRLKNNRFSFKVDSKGHFEIVNQYQGSVAKVGTLDEAKAVTRALNNGRLKNVPESLRTGKRIQAKNIGRPSFIAGKKAGKESTKIQMQKKIDFYKERLVSVQKQYGDYEVNRKTALDAIETFVPKGEKEAFINEFNKVKTAKQLSNFTNRIDKFVDRYEKNTAIGEAKDLLKYIKGNYKRGKDDFGAFDDNTKKALKDIFDGLDLKELTDVHSAQLQVELGKIQKTSGKLYKSMRKLKDNFPVDTADGTNIYEATLPEKLINELLRLEKIGAKDLTAQDIDLITKSASMLVKAFEQQQALKVGAKANVITGILKDTSKKLRKKFVSDIPKTPVSSTVELAKRFVHEDSQRLDTLAQSIAGKNSLLYKSTQEAFKGEIINRANVERRAVELFKSKAKEIGFTYKNLKKLNKTKKVTIGGKSYNMTRGEILSLDCTTRSKYGYSQLLKSDGVVLNRGKNDIKTGKITADELSKIVKTLTQKERNYGSLFFDINNEVTAPAVNEASNYMWGFSAATDHLYYPIERYFRKSVSGQIVKKVATEDMGIFKFRTGGKSAFRISPFTDHLFRTVESSAKFNGYAQPFQTLKSVLADKSFQDGLIKGGRQAELNNMITIIGRAENIISQSSAGEKLYKGVITRGAGSIILGNMKTLLAQAASYPTALHKLGFKNVSLKPVGRATIDKVEKYSDWLWYRWKSHNVNVELGNAAVHNRASLVLFGEKTFKDKLGGALIRFDQDAIGRIWNSSEKIISKTISKNSDDFYPAVARLTEKTVVESQPLWDSLFRSVNASDTGLFKRLAYMFRSPLEAQQNAVINAVTSGSKKEIASAIGAVGTSAVLYSLSRNTYDQARDLTVREIKAKFGKYQDVKTEKEFAAEVAKDSLGAMFGVIPGGREVFAVAEGVVAGYSNKGDIGDYVSKSVDDFAQSFMGVIRELGYKEKDTEAIALEGAKAISDGLRAYSLITGQPSGFFGDINALLRKQERTIITEIEPSTFESGKDVIKFSKFATDVYEKSSELKQAEKKRDLTKEEKKEQMENGLWIQVFNGINKELDEIEDGDNKSQMKQQLYQQVLNVIEGMK